MTRIRYSAVLWMLCLGIMTVGCRTTDKMIAVPHDQVLIYALPYDLVYLKTMDALQDHDDWEIEITEKESGVIRVYNTAYGKPNDADERTITFLVKRISRGETSIQIAPDDQRIPGGDSLLKLIAQRLNDAA